jgi:signal transduction histidine kinase
MKMFEGARLKLTAWYVLIIMLVSLAFSAVIYQMTSREIERFARSPRFVMENLGSADDELIVGAEQRLLVLLAELNGIILVTSASLAYFLAGRTLKPIKKMVEEQNQFISDASHELRTPLTSLKSAMEVNLRDKELTLADARKLIKENIEDVNQLQSLSDHLLQLTAYQKSDDSIKLERVELREIVARAVAKVEPMAKKKKITIERTKVENVEIKADKYNLNDLLVILLDNAIKYSPEKKTIKVEAKRTDGSVWLVVKDEGMGISKKDVPHIFERFYRADSARSKDGIGGYGLGLSIAKKIAEMHRGSISVKSQLGKGTTFTVKLPIFS